MLFGSVPDELAAAFGDGTINFTVNGEQKSATAAEIGPRTLLAEYLRYTMGLTGTKVCISITFPTSSGRYSGACRRMPPCPRRLARPLSLILARRLPILSRRACSRSAWRGLRQIGCGEGGCGACTVELRPSFMNHFALAPLPCVAPSPRRLRAPRDALHLAPVHTGSWSVLATLTHRHGQSPCSGTVNIVRTGADGRPEHTVANACMRPVCSLDSLVRLIRPTDMRLSI